MKSNRDNLVVLAIYRYLLVITVFYLGHMTTILDCDYGLTGFQCFEDDRLAGFQGRPVC